MFGRNKFGNFCERVPFNESHAHGQILLVGFTCTCILAVPKQNHQFTKYTPPPNIPTIRYKKSCVYIHMYVLHVHVYAEAYLSCFRRCPETPHGTESGRGICARETACYANNYPCEYSSTIRGRMERLSSFGFLPSSQAEEAESQNRGKRAKHANSTLDKEGPLMYASLSPRIF